MAAVIVSLSGCSQTPPKPETAPVAEQVQAANPSMPAASPSAMVSYAGTTSGMMSFESNGTPGSRKLNGTISLSLDAAGKMISGTYTADFISGRGKKLTITGQLAPASVTGNAFAGNASVEPPKNTPIKYTIATNSHAGTLSQDNSSITGVISGEGTFADTAESGTFSIRLDYSAAVAK